METIRVCIDADCPNCGYPERWADVTPDLRIIHTYGCNQCTYRSNDRNH